MNLPLKTFLAAAVYACAIFPATAEPESIAKNAQPSLMPKSTLGAKSEFAFSIENPGQLPLVEAVVNGTAGTFLLDTGAQITVLTPQFAKRAELGGRIHQQGAQVNGSGDGVDFAMINALKIGDAEFRDFHAILVDVSHLKNGLAVEPAGIIGSNVLLQAPFTLDYRSYVGTWNSEPPEGSVAVPARFNGFSVFLAASLDGKRLPMLLDTGSSVNAVYPKDWKGETFTQGKTQMGLASGTSEHTAVFAKVGELNVGGIITQPAPFRVLDTHRCLGTPFLKGRAIHLNAATQKVLLTLLKK